MFGYAFSLESLAAVLILFGVAPGFVLRLIVLAFHPEDPRRYELRGELYAVPRWERPFWVAEQIEIAISEGLWGRLVWAATGRIIYRWRLRSGVKLHEQHPDTFWIPSEEDKNEIKPGYRVKLVFNLRGGGERMWVVVDEVRGTKFVGTLWNHPAFIPRLYAGDTVKFKRDHIIDVLPPRVDQMDEEAGSPAIRGVCECCSQPGLDDAKPKG